MASSTWPTRELPILEALAAMERLPARERHSTRILEETRLDPVELELGLVALLEGGYIAGQDARTQTGSFFTALRLLPEGRREVGQWPRDPYEALLAALKAERDAEPDPQRRGRVQTAIDAVVAVGKDVVTRILIDIGEGRMRLP